MTGTAAPDNQANESQFTAERAQGLQRYCGSQEARLRRALMDRLSAAWRTKLEGEMPDDGHETGRIIANGGIDELTPDVVQRHLAV